MKKALQEAKIAESIGEVPIGAVIVYNNQIIASAHNMKETKSSVEYHAEMIAIQMAEKNLNKMYLDDCDMYVTLEPCMMCTGAISLARIKRLYYGTSSSKTGTIHSALQIKAIPFIGTYPKEIYEDILHEECSEILKKFFKQRRHKNIKDKQTSSS